uniref:Uncharacterized protein n=1 Tax=Rhipicephalus zambeziensis TaxID=60191 RepID=A0A224YFY4_9ACAR
MHAKTQTLPMRVFQTSESGTGLPLLVNILHNLAVWAHIQQMLHHWQKLSLQDKFCLLVSKCCLSLPITEEPMLQKNVLFAQVPTSSKRKSRKSLQ